MRNLVKTAGVCSSLCVAGAFSAYAQNLNTPYSIYNVGDIDFRAYNRTNGMASTGLALSSSFYLIDNNPASLTGLTRSFYLVDASGAARSVHYSGSAIGADNSNASDFWIKRFGVTVKINKVWASGFGLKQFSDVNYQFTGNRPVEGSTTSFETSFKGDGGLNEYYWTNAVALGKHFSMGLRSSLIAGPIEQTETVSDPTQQSVITTVQQDYFGQLRFQSGILYTGKINEKWDLSLGGKFIPRTNMVSQRTLSVTQNDVPVENDQFVADKSFALPMTFGAGAALKRNKVTTFAIDFLHEAWSPLNLSGNGWQLINSNRISGGVEFSRQKTWMKQQFEKRYLQAGLYYSSGSLQINGLPVNQYGMTVGMGGTLSSTLLYTLSGEAGVRGTTRAGLLKENFFQLTIGLTYRDVLLSKGKKYD